ncbi:MAG: glycosyltransferase family 4 protein [Solirubrobacteraceae bacterium]
MRIAYLIGHYPAVTHTFILREIQQMRRQGFEIETFSVWRASEQDLLTPVDRAEDARTYALLPPLPVDYLRCHLRAALRAPGVYLQTLSRALRLSAHGLRGRLLGLSWFLEAVVVQRSCEQRGIRHVHVHLDGTAPAVGLLVAYLGNGAADRGPWSFSMTVHGSKEFFDVARQGIARKVEAARFVICISDFTRSQLMALVDDTHWPRLHVLHCGIDPEHFAPPEEGRPSDGPLRVLTVGRLDNMKGVTILVEAVGELRRRGVAVALTVVGDGPQREHLQRLAERNSVGEDITWAGPVGQDTIREHYHAADVFCLPSFAEGIPVVLMEAMSTGLPVVANRITGIPELVEDEVSGLLVRPGRTDLLVDALQRLAADADLRARMGQAGREKVRREFESGALGGELAELFAEELAPSGAQPSATPVAART